MTFEYRSTTNKIQMNRKIWWTRWFNDIFIVFLQINENFKNYLIYNSNTVLSLKLPSPHLQRTACRDDHDPRCALHNFAALISPLSPPLLTVPSWWWCWWRYLELILGSARPIRLHPFPPATMMFNVTHYIICIELHWVAVATSLHCLKAKILMHFKHKIQKTRNI